MTPREAVAAGSGGESLRRAADGVIDEIRSGKYRPGDRLPPERELARVLAVSRSTLRLAFHDLQRAGLIVRRPGRGGGTFVAAPKVERDLGQFAGLGEYIRRQGLTASARVISVSLRGADDENAAALDVSVGDAVLEIVRVRLANGEPIALERSVFPAETFPGLAEQPLGGSLFDLLREQYGVAPARAVERIEPVAVAEQDAALLGVAPGTPLLAVQRVTYSAGDVPVEHAHDLFRGDRTCVVVWGSASECEPGGHHHPDTC